MNGRAIYIAARVLLASVFVGLGLERLLAAAGVIGVGGPASAGALAFVVSFAGSLAMWWLYFDTSAEVGSRVIAGSQDPGKLARLASTYIHLFLVAGIILMAVADEFVLAHPLGHAELKTTAVVLGGAAIYLLGDLLFKWAIAGRFPWSPLVGVLALAGLLPVAARVSPLMLMTAATLVLVAIAAWEARTRRRCPPLLIE